MKVRSLVIVLAMLAPHVVVEDVAGFWAHLEMPVWVEVSLVGGTGVAVRNDDCPDKVA